VELEILLGFAPGARNNPFDLDPTRHLRTLALLRKDLVENREAPVGSDHGYRSRLRSVQDSTDFVIG
jgi:hypothetical protein